MKDGESAVRKTYLYILLLSFIISLMGMAMLRWSGIGSSGGTAAPTTTAQRLKMLATIKPESPQMAGFLQSARQNQEASREVNGN